MAVSRVDNGYQVRVQRQNVVYGNYHADSAYGSAKNAKKAAEQQEEQLLTTLPPPERKTGKLQKPLKKNSTGVLGISETFSKNRSGECSYVFAVNWDEGTRKRFTTRSIKKYGREEAWERACQLKEERDGILYTADGPWLNEGYPPVPPEKTNS